jgi:hypothetical protein
MSSVWITFSGLYLDRALDGMNLVTSGLETDYDSHGSFKKPHLIGWNSDWLAEPPFVERLQMIIIDRSVVVPSKRICRLGTMLPL